MRFVQPLDNASVLAAGGVQHLAVGIGTAAPLEGSGAALSSDFGACHAVTADPSPHVDPTILVARIFAFRGELLVVLLPLLLLEPRGIAVKLLVVLRLESCSVVLRLESHGIAGKLLVVLRLESCSVVLRLESRSIEGDLRVVLRLELLRLETRGIEGDPRVVLRLELREGDLRVVLRLELLRLETHGIEGDLRVVLRLESRSIEGDLLVVLRLELLRLETRGAEGDLWVMVVLIESLHIQETAAGGAGFGCLRQSRLRTMVSFEKSIVDNPVVYVSKEFQKFERSKLARRTRARRATKTFSNFLALASRICRLCASCTAVQPREQCHHHVICSDVLEKSTSAAQEAQ